MGNLCQSKANEMYNCRNIDDKIGIPSIYVVGNNRNGLLGVRDNNDRRKLTQWTKIHQNICIKHIYCMLNCTIFVDKWNEFWIHDDKGILSKYNPFPDIGDIKGCTNIAGSNREFITNSNKLWIKNDWNDRWQFVNGIVDKKENDNISIILQAPSCNFSMIIEYWLRKHNVIIPPEIEQLTLSFYGPKFQVYLKENMHAKWTVIDSFNNKNIIKIGCTKSFPLYLGANGDLWSHKDFASHLFLTPEKIQFLKQKHLIKDIKCGWYHVLALDNYGNVYSMGNNQWGQCGNHWTKNEHETLKKVERFSVECDCTIIEIKCGSKHSYAKSYKKEHYLWGNNKQNQCSLVDSGLENIYYPLCINSKFEEITGGKCIDHVFLGHDNTFIIAN